MFTVYMSWRIQHRRTKGNYLLVVVSHINIEIQDVVLVHKTMSHLWGNVFGILIQEIEVLVGNQEAMPLSMQGHQYINIDIHQDKHHMVISLNGNQSNVQKQIDLYQQSIRLDIVERLVWEYLVRWHSVRHRSLIFPSSLQIYLVDEVVGYIYR